MWDRPNEAVPTDAELLQSPEVTERVRELAREVVVLQLERAQLLEPPNRMGEGASEGVLVQVKLLQALAIAECAWNRS